MLVTTLPGAIALTRTPLRTSSFANPRVIQVAPHLETLYGLKPVRIPAMEVMLIIFPYLSFSTK